MRGLGQEGTWALTTFLDDISDILPRNLQGNNGPVVLRTFRRNMNVRRVMVKRCPRITLARSAIRSVVIKSIFVTVISPRMGYKAIRNISIIIFIFINFDNLTVHSEI